jgi:hypothetical protein
MFLNETPPENEMTDEGHEALPDSIDIDNLYEWLERPVTEEAEYQTD